MIYVDQLEYVLYPASLCVGDKHLTEIILADQLNKLVYTVLIQLVEDVIEKQDRLIAFLFLGILEHGQLDGDNK
jgi:hypothetical protein